MREDSRLFDLEKTYEMNNHQCLEVATNTTTNPNSKTQSSSFAQAINPIFRLPQIDTRVCDTNHRLEESSRNLLNNHKLLTPLKESTSKGFKVNQQSSESLNPLTKSKTHFSQIMGDANSSSTQKPAYEKLLNQEIP